MSLIFASTCHISLRQNIVYKNPNNCSICANFFKRKMLQKIFHLEYTVAPAYRKPEGATDVTPLLHTSKAGSVSQIKIYIGKKMCLLFQK